MTLICIPVSTYLHEIYCEHTLCRSLMGIEIQFGTIIDHHQEMHVYM